MPSFIPTRVAFIRPHDSFYRRAIGPLLKLFMDKLGALTGLILFSPVLLILAVKIKRDGGPAFYAQKRVGQDGKIFKCYKLRSMIHNADEVLERYLEENPEAKKEWEKDFKLKNDPRITKIGHFIRKTSLDELPQFYNVLKGEMSIVGPRPIVKEEMKFYGSKVGDYLAVKPGITGPWQVSGRNDVSYEKRVQLDSWYANNWSLWTDIKIIFKTVLVVLRRDGAY
jgi:undecaprenyl-phosphate galactose phosphotransferase